MGKMEITTATEAEMVERAAHTLSLLRASLQTQNASPQRMQQMVEALTKPTPRVWLQKRVVDLLVLYFVGADLGGFSQSIGESYDRALRKYPAWALDRAINWWAESEDNPNAHRKPLPADLAKRANVEMRIVRVAEARLVRNQPPTTGAQEPEAEEPKFDSDAILKSVRKSI